MNPVYLLVFLVCMFASLVGNICGIGGGIIIKPTLDSLQIMTVASVSFLSGITVLSMSLYSVARSFLSGHSVIRPILAVPLSVGAILGGILGKQLFSVLLHSSSSPDKAGVFQSAVLFLLTLAALIYTWKKDKIRTRHFQGNIWCLTIGLLLGLISSFLGIGGGPLNLIFLSWFFSMETKEAAENSLFIILFSQLSSLFLSLGTGDIPAFSPLLLAAMIVAALTGAALGRLLNKRLDNASVDRLFAGMMGIILVICARNIYLYL